MVEAIGRFILWAVFDVVLTTTGEIVLWAVTLGRCKPRWVALGSERPGEVLLISEASFWVGFTTWLIVGVIIYLLGFRNS